MHSASPFSPQHELEDDHKTLAIRSLRDYKALTRLSISIELLTTSLAPVPPQSLKCVDRTRCVHHTCKPKGWYDGMPSEDDYGKRPMTDWVEIGCRNNTAGAMS